MDVTLITERGPEAREVADLGKLLAEPTGIVWVDVPSLDAEAVTVLSEVFCFHPQAVEDCGRRNTVAKTHAYGDHVFVVLHAPERGAKGHVHYVELDQFVGPNDLTRTNTKMTIAAERLAVIAAVTLPVTALSSIIGMNVIVNDSTHLAWLVAILVVMAVMSGTLLAWAKRRGWW